jgi:hypothetical protein
MAVCNLTLYFNNEAIALANNKSDV